MKIKQVIVVRTHYPDQNGGTRKLRTGKMMAQVAHASMGFLVKPANLLVDNGSGCNYLDVTLPLYARMWLEGDYAKIVCHVKTEQELLDLEEIAKEMQVTSHLVTDAGLTEFNGVPTITCLAIGPWVSNELDMITGELPLY